MFAQTANEKNMNFKLSFKPSPVSSSDSSFQSVKLGFNKVASATDYEWILPELTPISNQGSLSSCAGNATADATELLLGLQNSKIVQLSRLFIYYNARNIDKATNKDEGTYIKSCFQSIMTLGVCPEDLWVYDAKKVYLKPNLMAYAAGNDNKIQNFYRIASSGYQKADDVELALKANHPVVFGCGISQEFANDFNRLGEKVWDMPSTSIGGHAMIITGVRVNNGKREFQIRNSWGSAWGSKGRTWMTENYLMNGFSDLWVPTAVDSII